MTDTVNSLTWEKINNWKIKRDYQSAYAFTQRPEKRLSPNAEIAHFYFLRATDLVYAQVILGKGEGHAQKIEAFDLSQLSPFIRIETGRPLNTHVLNMFSEYRSDVTGFAIFRQETGSSPCYKLNPDPKDEYKCIVAECGKRSYLPAFVVLADRSNFGEQLVKAGRFVNTLLNNIEIAHQIVLAHERLKDIPGQMISFDKSTGTP